MDFLVEDPVTAGADAFGRAPVWGLRAARYSGALDAECPSVDLADRRLGGACGNRERHNNQKRSHPAERICPKTGFFEHWKTIPQRSCEQPFAREPMQPGDPLRANRSRPVGGTAALSGTMDCRRGRAASAIPRAAAAEARSAARAPPPDAPPQCRR